MVNAMLRQYAKQSAHYLHSAFIQSPIKDDLCNIFIILRIFLDTMYLPFTKKRLTAPSFCASESDLKKKDLLQRARSGSFDNMHEGIRLWGVLTRARC